MFTLKNAVLGEVIDVIHSPRTNRFYLVLESVLYAEPPHYLVPLLCPVCGEPWHFMGNQTPEELLETLIDKLTGYELVEVKYHAQVSTEDIKVDMQDLSEGSPLADLLIKNIADHAGDDVMLPAMSMTFELHTATGETPHDEVSKMDPAELQELLDLEDGDDLNEAIQQLEEWIEADGFENYKVEDEFTLIVHPTSILDAVVVEPEPDVIEDDDEDGEDEEGEAEGEEEYEEIRMIYPYDLMLKLVEEADPEEEED